MDRPSHELLAGNDAIWTCACRATYYTFKGTHKQHVRFVDAHDALAEAGYDWEKARLTEREIAARCKELMREAQAAGMSETRIAAAACVDRMTVRRALGKL